MRATFQTLSFLLSAIHSFRALASPSINVALRASFNSAPFLIELLETAADENSTAYFPILDRIADGYFESATTDHRLYNSFIDLLRKDGHITDAETLASFRFALSVHSAAPRIEAHYQYYNTSVEPSLEAEQGQDCEAWVAFGGKQYCSPQLDEHRATIKTGRTAELPFDRVLGDSSNALPSILYADITSPSFARFHKTLRKTARAGDTSYRLRYKPSISGPQSPLAINGYGIELALKRTDYIVIDDRLADQAGGTAERKPMTTELHDEEVADLKPLSASEVSRLGLNAASFVMQSDQPLDTLLRLCQDFPKHSSAISAHNASDNFLSEHRENREHLLPSGYNIIWINGVQMPARDINPFTLLEHLRRERKLINGVRALGLSAPEAINILSHSAIMETQAEHDPQRYDFRDEVEGGHVIMWLNDITKDKRYQDWPESLMALLQRTYPGQLPPVRKDIHNAIVPTDFSDIKDVTMVVDTLQSLVKRKVPVRWGLVPSTASPGASAQAKIVYYLLESYGLSAALKYLEASMKDNKLSKPDKALFEKAVSNNKLRKDHEALSVAEVLGSDKSEQQVAAAKQYLRRLAADGSNPPVFANGVPIPRTDEWLQTLSNRISIDLREIQKGVFEEIFTEDSWLPTFFLFQAALKRNPLVIPEDEKSVEIFDLTKVDSQQSSLSRMPHVPVGKFLDKAEWTYLVAVADFDSISGIDLLTNAVEFRKAHANVELVIVHNPKTDVTSSGASELLFQSGQKDAALSLDTITDILARRDRLPELSDDSKAFWKAAQSIPKAFGLSPGQAALVLNGRRVGPIPHDTIFAKDDFETLLSYEMKKRVQPTAKAAQELGLAAKMPSPLAFAKLSSLIALSSVSDVPEGMFETASTVRMNHYNAWNSSHTAISVGDIDSAIIQIVASIDPATELAQTWVPMLTVLSELEGVHLRIFLNPREKLEELPVKRFYRYILNSQPAFNQDGSIYNFKARFIGIPAEALLTMGMDVPPSWLVAPEWCIHDLDNIRLSTLGHGESIDAMYELESILIEGHSRDVTTAIPPRGAELVLATEKNPHFADTIIMANLGYFQFKANPGFFKIGLKSGRSQGIFNIDSAGTLGWNPQPGDETTEIALMSFQGTTLFPRLSRKPGQEEADVLASSSGVAGDLAEMGTQFANQILSKVGLSSVNPEKLTAKGSKFWSSLLTNTGLAADTRSDQADINIFSVASGHLYERMLNIMIVSVMRHTKHTVKFWFIEQFLSPSFKSFLPTMAAAYGFDYEMVTYKWPHWLRGQKEKQREIWGYKILFLDVLFPLDLDKVIFVDADQIVRTDMYELVQHDLKGAPYGFAPMCDSRTEMEGFRFWKTGYWKNFLRGMPYHISALYVVDLKRFRQIAAGDRLRQQYHTLSADPQSLSNLDQDLPNNMQMQLPIHSLPQEWLWCETWCDDASLKTAKTIDLCNNPQTKEPKLERARRQVPEWTVYDEEIAALARRTYENETGNIEEAPDKEHKRIRDEL